jgi:Ca2+-binding RTX toxin-like protein
MGRSGNDHLLGGAGSDTATYIEANGSVTVDLGLQSATGADGNDTLDSIENATGSHYNDVLLGSSGNNVIDGSAGDDQMDGAAGSDTASYASASMGVSVSLLLQGAAQNTLGAGSDTLLSFENLTGSSYNDRLIGDNNANRIAGGNGLDVITLGGGNDTFAEEIGTSKMALKTGTMSVDIITDFDASGNDVIDLTGLGHFNFRGTANNSHTGDLTFKTYTSLKGAESALGMDIHSQPGANVSGPVTVVYGNTDGGAADFAIVLLNHNGVAAGDFIYS